MNAANTSELVVWDPLVRLFHWTLVAAFCAAYLTEGEPFEAIQEQLDGAWLQSVHVWAEMCIRDRIKTAPEARLVSSIFFMCLPEQVLVYGDCAININPSAEDLADIAIQSAESAKAFGITPRVAMLSYSTGTSGAGSDVEKVKQATRLARQRRPDLLIDGPLQYDAATIKTVAQSKACLLYTSRCV